MAAQRAGEDNPIAKMYGVSHKCLAPVAGIPMIERVITQLRTAQHVDQIIISIEEARVMDHLSIIKEGMAEGWIRIAKSEATLPESVLAALRESDFPAIITTADNVLHTPEMIDYFCDEFARSDADAVVALTPISLTQASYPDGQTRYYKFSDGGFSNCNLYGLRQIKALTAVHIFRSGGQFIKKQFRILREFGIFNFFLYKTRLVPLSHIFSRLSRRLGVPIKPVIFPFAEAPIDVDNERTERIAREILSNR